MRPLCVFALLVVLVPTSQAQETSTLTPELGHFFDELARSVREGDFATYEALFHVDAVGVVATSETEKRTAVIAETLKRNKIAMAVVRSGARKQQLKFKFVSVFQDSSSALVAGMLHFWRSEEGSERVEMFGYFEMYLLKRAGWKIVANQQGASTREEWDKLD